MSPTITTFVHIEISQQLLFMHLHDSFQVFFVRVCSLSGRGFLQTKCEKLASAIKAVASNLRELELSSNILGGLLCSVLSGGLGSLEKLR